MTKALIELTKSEHIAILTLTRAEKRNALNGEMVTLLREHLKHLAADASVSVVMLQGEGTHFCAGGDIQWMRELALKSNAENYQDALELAELMYELYVLPKPTIVLTHGITLGGGLGLIAACDIAIGTDDSRYCFSEVKIGIAPSIVSPYVVAAMGERLARYYFISGVMFEAQTAKNSGLLHEVVPAANLSTEGFNMAERLLQNSNRAMIASKHLVQEIARDAITPVLTRKTAEHLTTMRTTSEAQEGLKAFIEKRKPRWLA